MYHNIRVMLIDDEYLAIEDLKTLIDWNSLGFEICSTACSGRQALHIFKENPADLVITDISMPGMDGISLIEQLKKQKSDLLFLLLTAYAEVDYMKRAFKLGVQDYLIKDEITPQLLRKKLSEIHENYLISRRQHYSFMQKNMRQYFNCAASTLPERMEFSSWSRLLYCILTPDIIVPWIEESPGAAHLTVAQMLDRALLLAETFETEGLINLCAVPAYNNKIVVLLKAPDTSSTNKMLEILRNFSHELITKLKKQSKLSFSCFYSYIPMTLEAIHRDYFSRQKNIRARYFLGQNTVEPLDSKRLYITNRKLELTEDTLVELFEKADGSLNTFVDSQFETVIQKHNYQGLTQLVYTCFWFLSKHIPDLQLDYTETNLADIRAVHKYILLSLNHLVSQKNTELSYETRKALSYINVHYNEESLSIQDIADEVGLSTTHFSRVFKDNTGETVWDYLTSLRMKHACHLLAGTDKKIYEIAEETGYSSPQYFSQVFYKQLGMKPLDYRRKMRR